MASDMIKARLEKLQKMSRSAGLDVVALVPGATLTYVTGISFHLSKRPMVLFIPTSGDPTLIIPVLEVSRVAEDPPYPIQFFTYTDAEGYQPAFERACKAIGLMGKQIAVEGLKMRVLEGQMIEKYAPGCLVTSADDLISQIRLHKEESELAAMRAAIQISQKALDATVAKVRAGMTERQITNILLLEMAENGGNNNAFEPIVLAGANSAQPHGVPGDVPIGEGDLLLFDFGTTVDYYPADITRTFAIGQIDDELRKVYDIVLTANEAGIRSLRPGIPAQEVDRTVRRVIEVAGYGKYFIHRTGHGLGLDIHEAPYILEGNTQVLEPGMVFTVEPGIYLPGKGGIRIEDNVTITETGAEVLTSYPKALHVIAA